MVVWWINSHDTFLSVNHSYDISEFFSFLARPSHQPQVLVLEVNYRVRSRTHTAIVQYDTRAYVHRYDTAMGRGAGIHSRVGLRISNKNICGATRACSNCRAIRSDSYRTSMTVGI